MNANELLETLRAADSMLRRVCDTAAPVGNLDRGLSLHGVSLGTIAVAKSIALSHYTASISDTPRNHVYDAITVDLGGERWAYLYGVDRLPENDEETATANMGKGAAKDSPDAA